MKKIIKKSAQVFLLQSILFPWSFGIRYLSPYSVYPLFYTLRFKYTLLWKNIRKILTWLRYT